MTTTLLKGLCVVLFFSACSASRNNRDERIDHTTLIPGSRQPDLIPGQQPHPLSDLARTQDGGYILAPGFYEAEFKTYCLQPGTPDPREGDAYLQGPVTGRRKEIIESVLLNSRKNPDIPQRNVQLLLWSAVSGADFNKLPSRVQADARKLLTPKQVFQLNGGVAGLIKSVSYSSGILNAQKDIKTLFELGNSSYETFERLAVLAQPSQVKRRGVQADQWYEQEEKYYIRYFPVSYQKVRIQVYVPGGLLDDDGKRDGEYLVFDPTGRQAIPAFTNAQRLGVGAPIGDIVKVIIQVTKQPGTRTTPQKKKVPEPAVPSKQLL
jgi:hypothetical protein